MERMQSAVKLLTGAIDVGLYLLGTVLGMG